MWTVATCYAFAARHGASVFLCFFWCWWCPMVWLYMGDPMLQVWALSVSRDCPKRNRLVACGKMTRRFPVDFESPSSSRSTITSQKKLPKLRSKAETILCGGSSYVFWRKLFGHCFVVKSTFGGGQCFLGVGKGVQEASSCWSNVFKFSAAKYVTLFFDVCYILSCTRLERIPSILWIHIPNES